MDDLLITFVGSGDYCNHGGRAQQAILFERGGQGLLIDFGANTCYQLKKLHIPYRRFQTILLTHFHGDHCGGLPYMIAELNNGLKTDDITAADKKCIVGPRGVTDCINNLCQAMNYSTPDSSWCEFVEFGQNFANSLCRITALSMEHRPESLGYRLDFGDLTVAVTGDTRWCDNIAKLAFGADLLIIDVNRESDDKVHVSLSQISAHFQELNCRHILPVHIDDLGEKNPLPRVEDGTIYRLNSAGELLPVTSG